MGELVEIRPAETVQIKRGRAKLLRDARPQWVMLGLEWPGPGVLLMASRSLTAAQLDFRARAYHFDSIEQLKANFQPELTLDVHMRDDYVLVAGPDYATCLSALLRQWSPDGEVVVVP